MPKTTAKIVLIGLLLVCFCVPSTVVGYGGGGSEGTDAFASMEPQASGGVSWAPNPNGSDVMGSSIWDGRPENIQQGPYQPDKAVEDAEAELLQGLDGGKYTPEQVKEQLEWAQRVGIKLSPQAVKKLNDIKNPPPPKTPTPSKTPSKTSKKPSKPGKSSSWVSKLLKHKDDADVHWRVLNDCLEKANKGQQVSKTDVAISYGGHKFKKWANNMLSPKKSPDNQ